MLRTRNWPAIDGQLYIALSTHGQLYTALSTYERTRAVAKRTLLLEHMLTRANDRTLRIPAALSRGPNADNNQTQNQWPHDLSNENQLMKKSRQSTEKSDGEQRAC